MAKDRKMTFERFGRSPHLKIETADDLEHAVALDEANWVATNAPVSTINFDAIFLRLLDTDGSGRITCHKVKDAIRWLFRMVRDRDEITHARSRLRLKAINEKTDEGRRVHEAVEKMLIRQGQPDAKEVTLEQVRQIKATVESMPVSEAGVVLPEAAEDPEIRQYITDVVATVGGAPHPSGAQGVGQAELDRFCAEAAAYLDWHQRGQIPDGQDRTDVMPLGAETPAAYQVLSAVRGKIEQYFAQCQALTLDERFLQRMGWTEAELGELDFDDPAVIEDVLKRSPLARARPVLELALDDAVNPYYADLLERFRRQVAEPVLGELGGKLTAKQWQEIKACFAAHQAWCQAKPSAPLDAMGLPKVRTYLDERFAHAVRALIGESTKTAFVLDNIRLAEKLLLFQAYMIEFANNFVSFPRLYDAAARALFEMGTLVMDGRRFNLAVRVENRAEHMGVARTSNMYLLYVEVVPKAGAPTYEVAAPVTWGGVGNLCVGKRGVFYDLAGTECDARVVAVVDNPVSLREAILSPFRRLARLLTGKIESLTAKAEKKLDTQATGAMPRAAPGPGPAPRASTGGLLMGAGIATAALGSAVAYITKTLAETHWLAILIGILAAVLLVMLPTSIIGMLKLRKRDLSAALDGSGWGINARMRLTRAQSRFFTERPAYPRESVGARRRPWRMIVVILLILAAIAAGGYLLNRYVHKPPQATTQPAGK